MIKKIFDEYSKHQSLREAVRFGITGVVSTLVTYGVYYILLKWLRPTFSFTIAYMAAMVVNYLMTTLFTFKVNANTKNALGFIVSNGINYGLCTLLLNMFIWLGVSEQLAPIPMYAISIPVNFLVVRFVMKKN